jgi:hypothetical protein
MHHTGLLENVTPVVPGEQAEDDQQGALVQEAPGGEEPEADLPECPDHQPSSFLKGKPRSISPCGLQISNLRPLLVFLH